MEEVFVVVKNDNGNLAYVDKGIDVEDVLTLEALVTSFVKNVAETDIGLTPEEVKDNVYRAVNIGLDESDEDIVIS